MMFFLEIKGSTPYLSFMEPSLTLWHLEDSMRPSNDPSTPSFHHYDLFWMAYSSLYELLGGIVTKDMLFFTLK